MIPSAELKSHRSPLRRNYEAPALSLILFLKIISALELQYCLTGQLSIVLIKSQKFCELKIYYVQGVHSLIQQQNKLLGDIRERLGTQEEFDKEESDKDMDKVERMESARADELRQLRQFSEQMSRVVV